MKRTFFLFLFLVTSAIAAPPATFVPRASSDLTDAANIQLKNGTLAIAGFGSITGVFPIANIPTGTTGSTVALGNHTHAASSLTGTTLASGVVNSSLTSAAGGTFGTAAYVNTGAFLPASTVIPLGQAPVTHQFLTSYNPSLGTFGIAQPVFVDIAGTPTTLSGYGITDAVPSSRTVAGKALSSDITLASGDLTDTANIALLNAANTFTNQNTFTGGTITTSKPLTLTQTWNASGVTFTGLLIDITDTASASDSSPIDFRIGGSSIFKIRKDNQVTIGAGALRDYGSGQIGIGGSSGDQIYVAAAALQLGTKPLGFGSSSGLGSQDVFILRDGAANTLAQRNSTNAQTFNLYNTYTSGSVFERGFLKWSSNVFQIGTENTGGTNRQLEFVLAGSTRAGIGIDGHTFITSGRRFYTGGDVNAANRGGYIYTSGNGLVLGTSGNTDAWLINSSGHLLANIDNTYDIGASGATRPRNVYVAGLGVFGQDVVVGNTRELGSASNGGIYFTNTDGVFKLANNAGNDFGRLTFGGTTSSFPALKRSSAELQTRLADDSGFAATQSLYDRYGSGSPEGAVTAPVGASYHRTDGGAGTSFYVKESGAGNTGWVAK